MAEEEPKSVENSLAAQIAERRAKKRVAVKLTAKCRTVLVGSDNRGPGDTIELFEEQARELCISGHAEPVLTGWFTMPKPKKAGPKIEAPKRLDDPENGGRYQVKVKPRRQVFRYPDSYGEGSILFLTEADARLHVRVGNIECVDPPGLPADLEPENPKLLVGMNPYGCSGLVSIPASRRDAM
jgi:hypothetical protein